jgi:hypothetical protein
VGHSDLPADPNASTIAMLGVQVDDGVRSRRHAVDRVATFL